MDSALHITDTDTALRLNNKSCGKLSDLCTELTKLAKAEGARAIFRREAYEVLRCLAAAIEKLKAEVDATNGWLAIRPSVSTGKFIRCGDEERASG